MVIIDTLRELVGPAPAGLEFIEYIFAVLFVLVGLFLSCWLIKLFFGMFIR